eukprot:m.54227 g.54227  ORF g.54227 m.54227 type:complete len:396 (+) comp13609_c0_seq2:84-1271(+)
MDSFYHNHLLLPSPTTASLTLPFALEAEAEQLVIPSFRNTDSFQYQLPLPQSSPEILTQSDILLESLPETYSTASTVSEPSLSAPSSPPSSSRRSARSPRRVAGAPSKPRLFSPIMTTAPSGSIKALLKRTSKKLEESYSPELCSCLLGKKGLFAKQRRRQNNKCTQAVKSYKDKLNNSKLPDHQRAVLKEKLATTQVMHQQLKDTPITEAVEREFLEDIQRCAVLLQPLLDQGTPDPAQALHSEMEPFARLPQALQPSADRYGTAKTASSSSASPCSVTATRSCRPRHSACVTSSNLAELAHDVTDRTATPTDTDLMITTTDFLDLDSSEDASSPMSSSSTSSSPYTHFEEVAELKFEDNSELTLASLPVNGFACFDMSVTSLDFQPEDFMAEL